MRVLIADDELKVCELVTHLVNWEGLGMEIIGFAHDGETALDIILNQKPDIVITDIRMPGLSGLEMIKMAKKAQSNSEFIVISGFKQFDYAKEALQYGVSNYLLKPINRKELNYTLAEIQSRSAKKRDKALEDKKLTDAFLKNQEQIRKDTLYRMFTQLTTETVASLNADGCFRFQEGLFQVGILKIDGIKNIQKHCKYFTNKLKYLLNTHLTNCFDFEFTPVAGKYMLILNYDVACAPLIYENMKWVLDGLQEQQDIFQGFSVSGALGEATQDLKMAMDGLDVVKIRLNQRLIEGTNRIYTKDVEKETSELLAMLADFQNQLIEAVEVQNLFLIKKVLQRLESVIADKQFLNGHAVLNYYKGAFDMYELTLRKFNFYSPDLKLTNFDLEIENFGSVLDVHRFFATTLTGSFELIIEKMEEKMSRPVLEAKAFIRENFSQPISLEIVAEKVGFSASYFSSMFKEQTEESFSDYLFRKRMEGAKTQLRTTRNSVAVICENVGYSDLRSFTKSFKKYTGLTPKDYRKLYG